MADTLEQVQASEARKAPAPAPAPAPSKPRKRRRINLPESYPKQGFSLGEMPLTLFILLAAAIVYLHLTGRRRGTVGITETREGFGELPTTTEVIQPGGPVSVQPPAPSVPLPKFEMPKPVLVPIPGDPGTGGNLMN